MRAGPEAGISAIQAAAKGIKRNLLRIDEETTCNIGTLRSEYATNIVPERRCWSPRSGAGTWIN